MSKLRTYSELSFLESFEDRFNYLKLDNVVGEETFGFDRYLNQYFYNTPEWRRVRKIVMIRDNGCDLGIDGREIGDRILIHHMNPITVDDIKRHSEIILDPEYLICVSNKTHQAIHYGMDDEYLTFNNAGREAGDTCPWR